MPLKDPSFTIGIEEEYLLVDRASRDLVREMPHGLFEAASRRCGGQVAREFLKSQIEVGTSVHTIAARGRRRARRSCARPSRELAAEHGLAPIAASTHPFARWSTPAADRARALPGDRPGPRRRRPPPRHLRHARARRHRGRRAAHRPHEPGALFPAAPADALHLLAVRGGRGHRPQVLPPRRLPGAAAHGPARPLRELGGVPPDRRPAGAQRRHRGRQQDLVGPAPVRALSRRWRCASPTCAPGSRTPCAWRPCTCASCACSTACAAPTRPGAPIPLFLLSENRWRAQRYGVDGTLFDFGKGELVAFRDLVDELLVLLREDAEALGCLRRDRARPHHRRRAAPAPTGRSPASRARSPQAPPREEALKGVVDHLIAETVATDPAK